MILNYKNVRFIPTFRCRYGKEDEYSTAELTIELQGKFEENLLEWDKIIEYLSPDRDYSKKYDVKIIVQDTQGDNK